MTKAIISVLISLMFMVPYALAETPFDETDLISVDGMWEFYWNELLEPEDFQTGNRANKGSIHVPGSWNGYPEHELPLPGHGYATYRLVLNTNIRDQLAGLRIPRIFTAYRLWVNGEEIAKAGKVGRSSREVIPQYHPQQVSFPLDTGQVEFVVQVSNYSHRSGGILESLKLGTAHQVLAMTKTKLGYDLFLFGSLIIMAIYHLALFFFRNEERSLLYFGMFSLLVSLRTLFVGEIYIAHIFPNINWEFAHKVQTLTFYTGVYVVVLFFESAFPGYISKKVVQICGVVVGLFTLLVLFAPARIFTYANPAFQLLTVVLVIYIFGVLFSVIRRREVGTMFIAIGASVLLVSVLHDLLFLSVLMSDHQLFRSFITTGNLSSFGLLVFVVTHSLFLAIKFSKMAEELKKLNENLELMVAERTEALVASKKEIEHQKKELEMLTLIDPLTNLWNRRRFSEVLSQEWRRAVRTQNHLSLIFIDIDDFKAFNDQYGHQAGDNCLIRVAQVLNSRVRRSKDIVARFGGEEFVIVLPNTDSEGAQSIAESLRESVQEDGHSATLSLGVASRIPNIQSSPQELITAADRAMYVAKKLGKNRVEAVKLNAQP